MKNKKNLTNVCSFSLLIFLAFCQFMLFFKEAVNMPGLGGDEPYYVSKAVYLLRNGVLPKAEEGLEKSGWADYRAPGYPVFVALCSLRGFNINNARWRCGVAQFLLMALLLIILYVAALFAMKGSKWLYLAAFILGIQPWTFEYCANLLADSLCAFLAGLSMVSLFLFIKAKKPLPELIYILVSSILLSLSFMVRTEMLLLAPPLAAFAIIIKKMTGRKVLKHVLACGLAFFCFIGIHAGYRYYLTGKAELIPRYKFNYLGTVNWTQTWFNTEKSSLDRFAFGSAEKKMENLPPRAFGDDYERKEIARAISLYKVSGHTEEVDAIFRKIADKRIRDNFPVNFVLTRTWRSANLWLNPETNSQLLNFLAAVPALIRKLILAGLLLLKISVFLLAIVSFFTLIKRMRAGTIREYHYLTILAAAFVLLTTIFIGLILGSNEHRFVLKAWPAMLWCAISAIIDLYAARGPKVIHN